MAQMKILRPGMSMTVQDRGRAGLLRFGVSGSGPMDAEAMEMANALVGNPADAAALEFAFLGGEILFDDDRSIAVCAGVSDLRIGGSPVPAWASHRVRAGDVVQIGATPGTVWGYIAVSGGIATAPVLGSRATHLRSGLGGAALREGDTLPLGPGDPAAARALREGWRSRTGPIRVVMGPQDKAFALDERARFLSESFIASARRDRMAMVLEGPRIMAAGGHDIVSDGTLAGSVQVPGSGQPTVLMADRQTTGGYPKIATISSVDLPRLAQMPIGHRFRFQAVSQPQAEDILISARQAFRRALEQVQDQTVSR